jgi:hypothetical protein
MKIRLALVSLILAMLTLSSCEVVEGIFKAGVWVGILAVVGVIALIIFLASKLTNRK